ncbi:tail assembly protein [Pseudomonas protegens]|uniref:tail assembly protein n=1 Tax=Pseudomonas protegens TaxID=380021 RepID=UPI000F4AD101|nr:tail assembly protein [Pseudomonas protegens]ROL93210.1 phage tail protein [Pseudomonas protegens]ROL99382.1 phage tail protein [Pseudomonas protegens]ROM05391.1 phage tail protein [Pseudomonas protegens]ROM11866.1 phage tail protein [Pseudomonas protegens]
MKTNAEKMQTVIVTDQLARIAGRTRHRVTTSNGLRDVMGYFKQFRGFEKFMMEAESKGLRFAVFVGKENIGEDDLGKPTGRKVIRIAPVITGSKRAGSLQTIVGVVLIAVATIMTGGFAGIAAGGGWGAVGAVGISMAAGGVMSLLSAQSKGLGSQDSPNNRPSYSFNGAVNTSVQGNPVPLLYGRMIVGSAVISAGIYSEDQM